MGREIRKVPPRWQHPTREHHGRMSQQPMYDRRYEDAERDWLEACRKWHAGEDPLRAKRPNDDGSLMSYWEWAGNPPDREYHRPWKDEDATWFQVWETVTEGTPVTPPFATREELVDYLAANGDFWDQQRRKEGTSSIPCDPWPRANAERFVMGPGWAPSLIVADGKAYAPRDGVPK